MKQNKWKTIFCCCWERKKKLNIFGMKCILSILFIVRFSRVCIWNVCKNSTIEMICDDFFLNVRPCAWKRQSHIVCWTLNSVVLRLLVLFLFLFFQIVVYFICLPLFFLSINCVTFLCFLFGNFIRNLRSSFFFYLFLNIVVDTFFSPTPRCFFWATKFILACPPSRLYFLFW